MSWSCILSSKHRAAVGTMINVPMDLLRTFIAVTDLRSFTRAAQALGVTQPAVSAQIKRLQMLLGAELFDKSAPGVTLTAKGEVIVNYARRVLALNDQMLDVTSHGGPVARLRIGLAVDYFEGPILRALAQFRASASGAAHADLPRSIPPRCCATCAAATTISWSRRPTPSRPTMRRRRWLEPSAGARPRLTVAEVRGAVAAARGRREQPVAPARRVGARACGPGLPDRHTRAAASPAWCRRRMRVSVSRAGRGAASSMSA